VNEQVKTTATDISTECGVRVAIPDLYRSKIAYEVAAVALLFYFCRHCTCTLHFPTLEYT